jgi:hypothetical protein
MKYLSLFFVLMFVGCSVVAHKTSIIAEDQTGALSFKVRPPDAKIYVDGEFVGLAKYFDGEHRRLKILPGTHIVALKRDGYKDITKQIYTSDTEEHFDYDMAIDSGNPTAPFIRT